MTALSTRVPLRVKLVAAVLALVTFALMLISVASTVALRSYLIGRIDQQLIDTTERVRARGVPVDPVASFLPSAFVIDWLFASHLRWTDRRYEPEDLPPLPENLAEATVLAGDPYTVQARNGETRWRVMVTLFPDGSALTVGQDMAEVDSAVGRLVWAEAVIGAGVLGMVAVAGVAVVRTSLRPLRAIERTADAIAAGDLSRRVPEPESGADPPRTELGRVARTLNSMLTEIETAFAERAASEEQMRRFVADASHELRTPLTTIRGFAELYRQGAATSPEEVGSLLGRIEEEAARMGLLVEDLLLLARLDRARPVAREPVELPVIVSDAVQAARAVDPDRSISFEVAPEAGPLVVSGDEARLRQVLDNLLSNALTYTPAGSPVTVRLRRDEQRGVVEVADQGPGLTPEQAQRVFERFYRVDSARSRPTGAGRPGGGGSGLGLAIVAALVAAHDGTVDVVSTPGQGATFRVWLPLIAESPTADEQDDSRQIPE
jgi:two-component system OmpR family sensor kinase